MCREVPTAYRATHAVHRAVPLLLGALLLFVAAGCRAAAQPPTAAPGPTVGQANLPKSLEVPQYKMPSPNGYVEFEKLVKDVKTSAFVPDSPLGQMPTREDWDKAETTALRTYGSQLDKLPTVLGHEWLYPRELTPALLFPRAFEGAGDGEAAEEARV